MDKSDPGSFVTKGPTCAEHAQRPAVTLCTTCGNYACEACQRVGRDRQDYCFRCVARQASAREETGHPLADMPESAPLAASKPMCAEHPRRPASTICSRCGNYACGACQRVGSDKLDYCLRCKELAAPRVAEPGSRFAANLVDQLLVGVAFFVFSLARRGHSGASVKLLALLFLVGVLGLQLSLLSTTGQSLGKRMLGIKVVYLDGSPVGLVWLLFMRNFVPILIGAFTCNVFALVDSLCILGQERRCLHDRMARTQVIVVERS